jgi:hypothetical protein
MKQKKLHPGFQLAILRIGVAVTVLVKVFVEFSDLDIIFLSCLYILFAIAAFFLLIGFRSRLSALVCLLIHMMVFDGYNLTTFGFDAFLFSLLFYTLMFPVHKVYAVDALTSNKDNYIDPKELNLYLKIMQIHLCIVYFTAGISNYGRQEWMDGTIIKSLASNPVVCMSLTWGTLFAEIFFSLLIWIKWGRINRVMLLSIILMHVFIGAVMGLQPFAWLMIVFDLSAFAGVLLREKVKDSGSKWKALSFTMVKL